MEGQRGARGTAGHGHQKEMLWVQCRSRGRSRNWNMACAFCDFSLECSSGLGYFTSCHKTWKEIPNHLNLIKKKMLLLNDLKPVIKELSL